MLITQTSGFSYTHCHVSLPQRNKRSKTLCTDVFNLLQIWNVGCTAENPAGLSRYITLYIIVQVAGSVSDLSLATSAASVSSIPPNNSPTFKYLKIHLWVSYMFIVSSKFCFSSHLPKDNMCHSILDYFFSDFLKGLYRLLFPKVQTSPLYLVAQDRRKDLWCVSIRTVFAAFAETS